MSAELKVGDVILIENNSQIMADCLLLYADDKNG
jgi:magnesium-transporting ATPase (P-type)